MHTGFEDFVRTRGDTLRSFAYLLCGDRHVGEDLAQEVLIKAYRRWPSIDQPESYLRTALVRSHVSWLRRRSRREQSVADPVPDPAPDPAQRHAVRSDLWSRLGRLTRMQRAVLVLRYYEDLDDRQIAEVLGCGASTVRVHAARAGVPAYRPDARHHPGRPAMSIEDDLRGTLADRAAQPGLRPDLLDRVREGVRRDRRRRTGMLAAAAVLTAAAAATPMVLLRGTDGSRPAITATTVAATPPPSPALSTPSPAASKSSPSVQWQAPGLAPPTFPLTPDRTPAGLGTAAVGRIGRNALLQYDAEGPGTMEVEAGPDRGDWGNEGEENHSTTIGSTTATVRTSPTYDGSTGPGDRYVGVRWQLPDRRWVQVRSWGARTEREVLRYARGLRPKTMTGRLPFTFAELPRGLAVQHVTRNSICLAPMRTPPERYGRGLCADLEDGELGDGRTIRVGGRRAVLRPGGAVAVELVLIDFHGLPARGRVLVVHTDAEVVPLDVPGLIRVTEGIQLQ